MFNIIGKRYWFFLLSAIVIVPGTISLILFGLNPGPDFTGGTEVEVQIPQTSQSTQLNNLYVSATKTPPLPAGRILPNGFGTGGETHVLISAPAATDAPTLTTVLQNSVGASKLLTAPVLEGPSTCAPRCLYQTDVLGSLSNAQLTKLKAALAKKFPGTKTVPAGSVFQTMPGGTIKVQVPTTGAGGLLQSIVNGYAGTTVTAVSRIKSGKCPTDCRYEIITTTPLDKKGISAFTAQFAKEYPNSPALPGIQPEYVQPVIGSTTCQGSCYYIRSSLLTGPQLTSLKNALVKAYPGTNTGIINYTSVGGTVASSTKQNAIIAVVVAAIFILAYITFAFRHMPHPVRYGSAAIIAMLHDVLVVVGIFSILGKILHVEIDSTFITALLTIIGFSVHDTIVIFDRIRENVSRRTGEPFETIVNHSVLQSFVRSINTSFTVILTLGAIFLFSGESIRYFVLAMLIGIISGTYSSIFNASPILVVWQTGEWRKWFGGKSNPQEGSLPAPGRQGGLTRTA